jgi:hypothetical protein
MGQEEAEVTFVAGYQQTLRHVPLDVATYCLHNHLFVTLVSI